MTKTLLNFDLDKTKGHRLPLAALLDVKEVKEHFSSKRPGDLDITVTNIPVDMEIKAGDSLAKGLSYDAATQVLSINGNDLCELDIDNSAQATTITISKLSKAGFEQLSALEVEQGYNIETVDDNRYGVAPVRITTQPTAAIGNYGSRQVIADLVLSSNEFDIKAAFNNQVAADVDVANTEHHKGAIYENGRSCMDEIVYKSLVDEQASFLASGDGRYCVHPGDLNMNNLATLIGATGKGQTELVKSAIDHYGQDAVLDALGH